MNKTKAVVAVFMLSLMLLGSLPLVLQNASAVTTGSPKSAVALSLTVIPTRLPADSNSYPSVIVSLVDSSGKPSLALNATTVYLSSAEQSIGTLPASVVIPEGQGYAVASFTTTQTSGSTTLTASASGLRSSQAILATLTPSGFASHLKITPAPANVFARPGGSGSLVIQLQDDVGLPAKAAFNTNVSISSSNNAIAQLAQKWTIVPTGGDLAVINYTSGYAIGQAVITASASGFSSGTTSLGVIGSPPYSLKVSAEPTNIAFATTGRVVVWLSDPSGNPARASSPITVTITSSNLTVASVTKSTVTIATGEISAVGSFLTTSTNGTSTITASAQGLSSAFDQITNTNARGKQAELTIIAAPNPVLADGGKYSAIVVGIVDSNGVRADIASSNTNVTITSSNTAVGTVSTAVVIKAGQEFAIANFTSTYLVGSTTITASAQGLQSAQAQESSFGPIPASVVVSPVAGTLSADGGTYQALVVSLQDAFGNPAIAPSDVVVQLSSSRPNILSATSLVVIPTGQTYALASVKTGPSPGSSNITASASGYAASSTLLNTVVPAPSQVALYVGPNATIDSTTSPDAILTVQLQDINGFPAQAQQATSVIVTASNTTVFPTPITLNIPAGADYATTFVSTNSSGQASLTASSPGLGTSRLTLAALSSPVSTSLIASRYLMYTNESASLVLNVTALSHGVRGVNVQWTTTAGTLSSSNSTTGADGIASVSLYGASAVSGAAPATLAKVTAVFSSPFTGAKNLSATITILQIPKPPTPTFAQEIGPYVLYIVIAVVVAAAVVGFFFFRKWRRKKAAASSTAEESEPYDAIEPGPGDTELLADGGEGDPTDPDRKGGGEGPSSSFRLQSGKTFWNAWRGYS